MIGSTPPEVMVCTVVTPPRPDAVRVIVSSEDSHWPESRQCCIAAQATPAPYARAGGSTPQPIGVCSQPGIRRCPRTRTALGAPEVAPMPGLRTLKKRR